MSTKLTRLVRYKPSFTERIRTRGVTLIELIMVTALILIISYFSVPSYTNYIIEKRQDEGKQKILEIMKKQNHFKMMTPPYHYTLDLSELGYPLISSAVLSSDENPRFKVTASLCTTPVDMNDIALCVKLRADPIDPLAGDSIWEMQSNEGAVRLVP